MLGNNTAKRAWGEKHASACLAWSTKCQKQGN